jgi:hypothetical protein
MNLFDTAPSHQADPLSSYQAAETVDLKGWHRRIFETLKDHDSRPSLIDTAYDKKGNPIAELCWRYKEISNAP